MPVGIQGPEFVFVSSNEMFFRCELHIVTIIHSSISFSVKEFEHGLGLVFILPSALENSMSQGLVVVIVSGK